MKKLDELTNEEIRDLLENNKWLRETAERRASEDADYMVAEYMEPFRNIIGIDYSFGYPADFVNVGMIAYKAFLETCEQHEIAIFTEETLERISKAKKQLELFDDVINCYADMSDNRFCNLEKYISEIVERARKELVSACTSELEWSYSDEAIEEVTAAFCEFNGFQFLTDGKQIIELSPITHY